MKPSEDDFEYLRHKMVKEQLFGRDIKDEKVIAVFEKLLRHKFVDPSMQNDAYADFPLPIGNGQTISQPYMVALMVQLLDLKDDDRILEIGTGSGYETAILAELSGEVFSIERIGPLASKAVKVLDELEYKNIRIKIGDGSLGWEEFSPFHKIVVTASAMEAPKPLIEQLAQPGKLVMPVGPRFTQTLIVLEKSFRGDVTEKAITGCMFVPLIGKYGWEDW